MAGPFEFSGINHLALVCRDMARTVDFYTNVLGMPLIKTLEIPGGAQHFFFDCGNGDWRCNARESSFLTAASSGMLRAVP